MVGVDMVQLSDEFCVSLLDDASLCLWLITRNQQFSERRHRRQWLLSVRSLVTLTHLSDFQVGLGQLKPHETVTTSEHLNF